MQQSARFGTRTLLRKVLMVQLADHPVLIHVPHHTRGSEDQRELVDGYVGIWNLAEPFA